MGRARMRPYFATSSNLVQRGDADYTDRRMQQKDLKKNSCITLFVVLHVSYYLVHRWLSQVERIHKIPMHLTAIMLLAMPHCSNKPFSLFVAQVSPFSPACHDTYDCFVYSCLIRNETFRLIVHLLWYLQPCPILIGPLPKLCALAPELSESFRQSSNLARVQIVSRNEFPRK